MARKIEVQIIGDDSSLQRSFRNSSQASARFGHSIGPGMVRAAKLGAVAIGGLAAIGAVAGKRMIGLASDAGEVQSKLEVVFGRALPQLTKNIDVFSKATGTSRFEMREQAADMGALLKPILGNAKGAADMSLQFTKLATDLGSFNNVPTADALLAIRSGLVGEAEPLRRFGVLLNEANVKQEALRLGLVKGKEALTEQDKVQARASLIMKQTTLAQGDAIRTADSFANQLKRLKSAVADTATEIGMSLLPVATRLVGFFNDFLQAEGFKAKLTVVWEGIQTVATELFSQVKAAVAAVDWSGLFADAQGIATGLANKLTEAVRAIDWAPIGAAIGEGVSQALETAGDTGQKLGVSLDRQINSVDWRGLGRRVGEEITGGVGDGMDKGGGGGGGFFEALGRLTVTWYAALAKLGAGLAESLAKPVAAGIAQLPNLIGQGLARAFQAGARAIQSAASNWQTWALQAGKAVVDGVVAGLKALGGKIGQQLAQARAAITNAGGGFFSAAYAIGLRLVDGVVSGVGGLAGRLKSAISGAIGSALKSIDIPGFSPPEHAAAKAIGEPLGKGVIQGWIYSTRDLPAKMSDKMKAAIEAGRRAVEAARGRFSSAFSSLASDALSAFDAVTSKMSTPSEKALADYDRRKQVEGMKRDLSEAQAALSSARAEAEPDADKIIEAQRRVQDAEEALWRDAIEQQAKAERTALDDRNALRRRHFEERLAALEVEWAAEGVSASKAHTTLMALFKAFGVDWKKSGKAMGLALAEGIRESENAVTSAASAIANAGRRGLSTAGGGDAPRSFSGALAGAGASTVNVYVAGSVQAEQDLATTIRDTLARNGVRNDGTGL